jgi:hypothetical protein
MADMVSFQNGQRIETRYLSCAETAGLVRAALRVAFPGVRFSVRSKTYSGGASITVSWTDGPTEPEVDRVAGAFAGATFDGQTDCKSYHVSTLDGRPVHYGADFVFTRRDLSAALLGRAIALLTARGWDLRGATVRVHPSGDAAIVAPDAETQERIYRFTRELRPNGCRVQLKW